MIKRTLLILAALLMAVSCSKNNPEVNDAKEFVIHIRKADWGMVNITGGVKCSVFLNVPEITRKVYENAYVTAYLLRELETGPDEVLLPNEVTLKDEDDVAYAETVDFRYGEGWMIFFMTSPFKELVDGIMEDTVFKVKISY